MSRINLRLICAPLVGAALCVAMTQRPSAAPGAEVIAHYAAKMLSVEDNSYAGRIDIMLDQWSSDQDLMNARDTLSRSGANALLPLLQQSRTRVGVVLLPGVQGTGSRARLRRPRNLIFARELETKEGRQIVVLADQHLGLGEFERWGPGSQEELTLIDLRLKADGTGIGKVSGSMNVVYNPKTKMIEVGNFDKAPVRLSDVRPETILSAEPPAFMGR